ncbi:integral membrane protein [Paraphaeosphaeria sporulosa]
MDRPPERPAHANENLTVSEIGVCVGSIVLVTITIILRYTGRWILQQRMNAGKGRRGERIWGLDDLFNVLAFLSFYGLVGAVLVAIHRGMGVHVDVIVYDRGLAGVTAYRQVSSMWIKIFYTEPPFLLHDVVRAGLLISTQAIYVSALFYNFTLGMIKLSVLSLYHRILRGVQSTALRTVVWIVFGIVAANTFANVLVAMFQCHPIKAAWDSSLKPEDFRCVDINAFYLGNAITGVSTDAIVYFLSIPIVLPLHLDKKTKLQLLATMLVGGFAVVTSAVRLGFIPALLKDTDISYAMGIPMNWSVAEPAIGILVSSMPAIRAIRYVWRKPGEDSYGSGSGEAQSTLRSRDGQIQLSEVRTGTDAESAKTNESEEGLVVDRQSGSPGQGKISRTTEFEVSYSTAE